MDLILFVELTKILKDSRNEEELRHVWTEWHDKSGKPIKDSYKRFVELENEAANLNGRSANIIIIIFFFFEKFHFL